MRAVVTGAARGLGEGVAARLAAGGASVALIDISPGVTATAERIAAGLAPGLAPGAAGRITGIVADVADEAACEAAIAQAAEELGGLDALVNNAGIGGPDTPVVDTALEDFWSVLRVNLGSAFLASRAAARLMIAQAAGGSIVNLGSISWHLGLKNLSIYQTAKAAIEGMTRALARDLGEHGIRVNCVVPGAVRTPRQTLLWHTPEEEARILDAQCIKSRVEPQDIASMVLFLASDAARLCTGHSYFVDAGWR